MYSKFIFSAGSVILCFILLPSHILASSDVLDDFSFLDVNNFGGKRRFRAGHKVNHEQINPNQSIHINSSDDYLVEILNPDGSPRNLRRKALRIEYWAEIAGTRNIQFYEAIPNCPNEVYNTFDIDIPFEAGRNNLVMPLFLFQSAYLRYAYGFGIGGPLYVYQLDIVDNADLTPNERDAFRVTKNGRLALAQDNDALVDFVPGSINHVPPQLQVMHRNFIEDYNSGFNHLKLPRRSQGIIEVQDGIRIHKEGFLSEPIVNGFDRFNLADKCIFLTYSLDRILTLTIKLQHNRKVAIPSSTLKVPLYAGTKVAIEIPVSQFPNVHPFDVHSIWIFGPVTVHRIEITSSVIPSPCATEEFGFTDDKTLVDNLSMWRDTQNLPKLVTTVSNP